MYFLHRKMINDGRGSGKKRTRGVWEVISIANEKLNQKVSSKNINKRGLASSDILNQTVKHALVNFIKLKAFSLNSNFQWPMTKIRNIWRSHYYIQSMDEFRQFKTPLKCSLVLPKLSKSTQMRKHLSTGDKLQNHVQITIILGTQINVIVLSTTFSDDGVNFSLLSCCTVGLKTTARFFMEHTSLCCNFKK